MDKKRVLAKVRRITEEALTKHFHEQGVYIPADRFIAENLKQDIYLSNNELILISFLINLFLIFIAKINIKSVFKSTFKILPFIIFTLKLNMESDISETLRAIAEGESTER